MVFPHKFKVLEFEKYKGTLDPQIHLAAYIEKMSMLLDDEKLLIHFFHEGLTALALHWYVKLDKSILHNWKDLADAFLKQYKLNCDVASPGEICKTSCKRMVKNFKEYAQFKTR